MMDKKLAEYINRAAPGAPHPEEMRTALKCATLLAILFAGEPDIIDAVITWIS